MPPTAVDCASRWQHWSEEIIAGIEEWRLHQPKATPREMEAAIAARRAERRARMRQEVALASPAAEVSQACGAARPGGPHGGTPWAPRGWRERQVTTHQGQPLRLRRSDPRCPTWQVGLFPPR